MSNDLILHLENTLLKGVCGSQNPTTEASSPDGLLFLAPPSIFSNRPHSAHRREQNFGVAIKTLPIIFVFIHPKRKPQEKTHVEVSAMDNLSVDRLNEDIHLQE